MFGWIVLVVIVAWVGSEAVLLVTRRSRDNLAPGADRASLGVVWGVIGVAVFLSRALAGARLAPLPGDASAWTIAGLATIVLGLGLRWWAILTLRRAFTVDVAIAPGQQVVERGLYRWVRHPSYLGGLVSFLGLGLMSADLLGLLVVMVPVPLAFLYRIRVEEAALAAAFGEAYADYARRTKRLLPFIY